MASFVHLIDQRRLIGAGGSTTSGEIYFYYTGTTVKAPIYSDAALLTPLANPVVVAAGAIIPLIFLDDNIQYRRTIVYGDGSVPDTQDPIGNLLSDGDIGLPVGSVIDFSGASPPDGFLFCFGQEISREEYDELFETIGTQYGAGNGTTTFNLPDYRGRVGAGKDNMGGSAANRLTAPLDGSVLGAAGGFQTAVITLANLPAHSHDIVITDPGHTHGVPIYGDGNSGNFIEDAGGGTLKTVTTNSATTGITATSEEVGENVNHNNLQPTIVVNKIIKTASVSFLSILGVDLAEEAANAVAAIQAEGAEQIALATAQADRAEDEADRAEEAAAAAQAGVENFYWTIAEGVANTAVGDFFASPETGTVRIYERTGTAPFYLDVGDAAAPLTMAIFKQYVGVPVDVMGAEGLVGTDDAAAFEAAFAVASAIGGRVILSKPTYWVSEITVPANVTIYSSTNSAIRPHTSAATDASLITLSSNVTIDGVTFEDPSNELSNEDAAFLRGASISNVKIRNCTFQDMLATSVRINTLTDGEITYNKFRRNRPHAELADERSAEVYLVDNLNNVTVQYNTFEGLDTSGVPWGSRELAVIAIAVTSGTNCVNVVVSDNTYSNYRRSFFVGGNSWGVNEFEQNTINFYVQRNKGKNCGQTAIKWKGGLRTFTDDNICDGFELICQEVPDSLRGGIFMQINPESSCTGNKIYGRNTKLWSGTVVGATSTTITLPSPGTGKWSQATFNTASSGRSNTMVGKLLFIRSGPGAYQWRRITAYVPEFSAIPVWETGELYTVGTQILQGGVVYQCLVRHFATTFATDLAASRWVLGPVQTPNTATVAAWSTSSAWATSTAYSPGALVTNGGSTYWCTVSHTSDASSFATDLAASRWVLTPYPAGTPTTSSVVEVWSNPSVGILFRGNNGNPAAWVTATAYEVGDRVLTTGSAYVCDIAHTSGTFATDLENGLWRALDWADTRTARGFSADNNYIEDTEVGYGLSGPIFNSNFGDYTMENVAIPIRTYDPSSWATSTAYVAGDWVLSSGMTYQCMVNHTSGTFATDLAAGSWKQLGYYRQISFGNAQSRYVNYPNPLGTTAVALTSVEDISFDRLSISGAYRDCASFSNVTGLVIKSGIIEGAGSGRGDSASGLRSRYGITFNSVRSSEISNLTIGGRRAGINQNWAVSFQETNWANDILFVNSDLTGNASVSGSSSGAINSSFPPGAGVIFSQCKGAGAQAGTLSLSNASASFIPTISGSTVVLNVALTADRTLTINTTNPVEGQEMVVRRTGSSTGSFNLIIAGALEAVSLATGSNARFRYSKALSGWVRV